MKVFIIPGNSPDTNFALSEDGTVLKIFGDDQVSKMVEHYAREYRVDIVENPKGNEEVQLALERNKMRCRIATEGTGWARVELFRWQYGELPLKKETRTLNLEDALKKLAVGLATDEATRENTAIVLVYLASLLTDQEEKTIE